jgi:N-acetylglucosamine kinase-like BadF-type ATPase
VHRLVAGIDAGGTSLRIRFASEDGKTVAELQGRACVDYGPENVSQLIASADISARDVQVVYAGVAGISRQGMRQRWSDELKRIFPHASITLVPDYITAFHGAISDFGILVIAGTGSIVYGEYRGKQARVGGRGWEWGDWGSGVWITSELLRGTLNSLDGLAQRTKLVDSVCAHFGTDEPLALLEQARRLCEEQGRGFLVPVLQTCAQSGNHDALDLFDKAAKWLAEQVKAAGRQIGFSKDDHFPVATVGGLWDCGQFIVGPFARYLHESYPNASIDKPRSAPLEGAMRQAIMAIKQTPA